MGNSIKIQASTREKALEKAKNRLSIDSNSVKFEVELSKKAGNFLGIARGKNTYIIKYTEEKITESDIEYINNIDNIDVDGSFEIRLNEEGVFLKVSSPEGDGKPVNIMNIKESLASRNIVEVNIQKIEEVLAEDISEWVKIAPRKPELDRDAEISFDISKDKMKAYINYTPAQGGNNLSLEELKNILEENEIVYGIKEDKLRDILKKDEFLKEILIAEGKEPLPGRDGELIYHFTDEEKKAGKIREDGSVDFYDRQIINNTRKGDILVTLKEHVPGKPGINIKGKEVPPPEPKKVRLPSGKNVEKKDKKTLIAAREGHVVKKEGKIEVLPIYNVKGDLDLSIGKIDFVGNVYVSGNVLDGLEIKAGGDIEIRGNVEGANLISEGNIVIHKGFIGKDKAKIKAAGDIKIKFVENGIVNTGRDLFVRDAVMHSKVKAGGDLRIKGKKGLLVGGKVQVAGEIEANIIGSSLGTETILESGVNPDDRQEYMSLKRKIAKIEINLEKAKKAITILTKIKSQRGKLPYDKRNMYKKLLKTEEKLENDINRYRSEYKELSRRIKNAKQGRVKVNKQVFSGTKIILGDCKKVITDKQGRSVFVKEAGEVIQRSL